MKNLQFNVFKNTNGIISSQKHEDYYELPSPMKYLATHEPNKLEQWSKLPGKKYRHKLWRFGKTETFKNWAEQNKRLITSKLFGTVKTEFDGRLCESSVKIAIIQALNQGKREFEVFPKSNKNKPAHLQMVYVKDFQFTEIK